MKKISIIAALFIILLISGCSFNNNSTQKTESLNLEYSNINDEATQNKVSKLWKIINLCKNPYSFNNMQDFM